MSLYHWNHFKYKEENPKCKYPSCQVVAVSHLNHPLQKPIKSLSKVFFLLQEMMKWKQIPNIFRSAYMQVQGRAGTDSGLEEGSFIAGGVSQ